MTTALACHFHSMIYVPLYDTLGEPAIVHIINQSMKYEVFLMLNNFYFLASLKTVFVDKFENILTLLKLIEQVPTLKRIVLTKKLTNEQENEIRKKAKDVGIEITTYIQLRVSLIFR